MTNNKPSSTKPINDYERSVPVQLELFSKIPAGGTEYSQTLELYDALPKYLSKQTRQKEAEILVRDFEFRGRSYQLTIRPVLLVDDNGEVRKVYPGRHEELVEEVLRKLATEGKAIFLDSSAAVKFSIYRIKQELKKFNHTVSYYQVVEALRVLSLTRMELKAPSQKKSIIFSPISTLYLSEAGAKDESFVILSSFVTDAILEVGFRLCSYTKLMGYRTVIARRLHKRLAHHFKQAAVGNSYRITVTTLLRDFGIESLPRLKDSLRQVEEGLKEMVDAGVIAGFRIADRVYESGSGRLEDATVVLTPTAEFAKEIKLANFFQTQNKTELPKM